MDSEKRLILDARRGSKDAFSELIRLHQMHVRAYIARQIPRRDIRDDLAQEVFLNAYRSLGSYDAQSSLRTWLIGIAKNRILHHLRTERQRLSHEGPTLESTVIGWLAGAAEAAPSPELSALQECVKGLPGTSRDLITSFYFERRSVREIAHRAEKKEGAIWVGLSRIRQALKKCVEFRVGHSGAEA